MAAWPTNINRKDDEFFITPGGTKVPLAKAPMEASIGQVWSPTPEDKTITLDSEVITPVTNVTPKQPTGWPDWDAVVDGDAVDWEDTVNVVFGWLDWVWVRDEIAKWSEKWKEFLREIRNRRNLEWVTWEADKILQNIWFSTIKKETESPTLVSNEKALELADRILAWDKELSNLWLQKGASDEQITRFFKSQWESEEMIQAVLNARDIRLKEQRVSKDALTIIERKQQELDERVAREQADIQKQSERTQSLLQRQRALRWVWLSTATEADMADLQKRGDELSSAARTKANNELALFKAETEWAEAETIASLQKALQDSTKALNDGILAQADLENTLIAEGKIQSEISFNNLLQTLQTAWIDSEWVDKTASELLWYVSDKQGNPILVNWEKVHIWGITKEKWALIDSYVNLLRAWWLEKITTVPADLKNQVVAAYDLYAQQQILTASDEWEALWLIQNLWLDSTEKNIARIGSLIKDHWIDGAREMLTKTWLAEDFSWPIWKAFENISWGLTQAWADAAKSIINERLLNNDTTWAIDKLIQSTENWLDTALRNWIEAEKGLMRWVSRFAVKYAQFLDENPDFATWKIPETWEWLLQAFNETWWAEIAEMMTWLHKSIQEYRKLQSWAAFSEAEAEEYRDIFPWPFKSVDLNIWKIKALVWNSRNKLNDFYRDRFWAENYDTIFPDGISRRFDPLFDKTKIEAPAWPSFDTTWLNEDEINEINQAFWQTDTWISFDNNMVTDASWKTFTLLEE